ncbi:SpoIID/LytB domain-containing protein [Prochlorothrix hollandica]|uniref:SpoIID/LytB domain-containing protein n=1 Tax=Prochlorothrix hollandica TaxID=1223 RepID=UPI00034DBFCB|nr:SpoIID/LytB domain-containing protein [Prochlorothrix hollandica]
MAVYPPPRRLLQSLTLKVWLATVGSLTLGLTPVLPTLGQTPAPLSPTPSAPQPISPAIEVGIVQRFGQKPTDKLTLEALGGDQLTLEFATGGRSETVRSRQVTLDIVMEPLAEPQLQERVVLSSHRSFESAEDSGNQWRSRGIEVELAQPGTWQVWAKGDVYSTPLLRRLLVENLKQQGFTEPYLDSQVLTAVPRSSWIVNGYRYTRDLLTIDSGFDRIQVNQELYPGSLHLQPNSYGTYTLVNQVNIEDYLRGVVPHEIGSAAPQAAVEAQAILARTYALRNLRRFAIDDYELCADTQCQVYWGWDGTVERVDRAIAATQGLVLTYDNELVDAVYSSTTGGVTAAFGDVWNGKPRPYLQPVVDAVPSPWDLDQRSLTDEQNLRAFINLTQGFNEGGWRYFRWRVQSPLATLNQDLKTYLQGQKHPLANFKTIQGLAVVQRSRSGRVQQLQVQTDIGTLILEKDEIIRSFSAPNSILFYLEPYTQANGSLGGYTFIGGGLGHGVGLSQTGSYRLAELGWSSRQILAFYYTQTQVQPLTSALTFWKP